MILIFPNLRYLYHSLISVMLGLILFRHTIQIYCYSFFGEPLFQLFSASAYSVNNNSFMLQLFVNFQCVCPKYCSAWRKHIQNIFWRPIRQKNNTIFLHFYLFQRHNRTIHIHLSNILCLIGYKPLYAVPA